MLERPALPEGEIIACLSEDYGLPVARVAFLPLGADHNSALYRATTSEGADYFVKLRRDDFHATTVVIPKLLHDQGCHQVIAPLETRTHQLWTTLHSFTVTLFPFVTGNDGYTAPLSAAHWRELGRTLKQVHTLTIPAAWGTQIRREDYSAQWRDQVAQFQAMVETTTFVDPIAAELGALLQRQRSVIDQLVRRAAKLAVVLAETQRSASPQLYALCHGDLHAGNVLVTPDGRFYVVDWDTLIWAAKERDLMFAGGGLFANHRTPHEEIELFFQGYGPTELDTVALAYYRCERVVQDIAAYCEAILLAESGGEDRTVGLRQLASQFRPNDIVDLALRTEPAPPASS